MLAFGLAMDAFAVSVANGICYPEEGALKTALACGVSFGLFQAVMPLIGFLAGYSFLHIISAFDHWVALILLGIIGGRMIYGAIKDMYAPDDEEKECPRFSARTLIVQAFATSIDALAVGIGLGVIEINIGLAVSVIGIVTFFCSFVGVIIGRLFGGKLSDKAQLLGGIVLVIIGVNIFCEHTGLLYHAVHAIRF